MSRDFQLPGRSPVIACEGMAATSHPLASLAAVETLRAGGNAADAAVTAVAVLCVVEPQMTGIGGDCFGMISVPGQPVWGYNGCGRAGARASTEALLAQGIRTIASDSIHAVTVPGAIDAWAAILKAHGRFGLDRALAPAIRYAEQGFPVAARIAWDWAGAVGSIARRCRRDPALPASTAARRRKATWSGCRRWRRRSRRSRRKGRARSTRGRSRTTWSRPLPRAAPSSPPRISPRHRGEVVAPIATNYRGLDVLELPPNTQGLTALVLLNILERFDLATLDPLGADRLHLALEAARLAYAVRDTHVAEPASMRASVPALLDKKFAAGLAGRIDHARRVRLPRAPATASDTVYLTVVDRDRMAVSLINTLFSTFGVGICTEQTGIMLTNRGACFVLDPDHPNCFGPSKRPLHTIIPALAFRDGRCDLAFGVMGAHYQPMGHVQVVTNLVDYGMDLQTAIDCPRFFFVGETSVVERGVPQATIEGLEARGHHVVLAPSPWGGAQAIRIDWPRGVLIGGSDPRKDGCALGY